MENKQWRHGDVIVTKVDALPDDVKKLDRKEVFYGEVTGHAHRIDVGELFEAKDGKLYLKVEKMTTLTHEEHKTITLPKGIYYMGQARQYDESEGWVPVRD